MHGIFGLQQDRFTIQPPVGVNILDGQWACFSVLEFLVLDLIPREKSQVTDTLSCQIKQRKHILLTRDEHFRKVLIGRNSSLAWHL